MSGQVSLVLVLLLFAAYFTIAGLVVRNFRYKYGGHKVPRSVGKIVYVGLGVALAWIAIMLALRP